MALATERKSAKSLLHPVVAIGGSAGALDAFEQFFAELPAGTGATFVIVQHMDANQKSLLPELLAAKTKLPIEPARKGVVLKPEHVYIVEPGTTLELKGCVLHSRKINTIPNQRNPIDHFFVSVAKHCGANAVGLIVSGTGMDGTEGARAIKDAGGTVFVQDPTEAKFAGMPQSVINAGVSSTILPVRLIGKALAQLVIRARGHRAEQISENLEKNHAQELKEICKAVLRRTGHDFSAYKKSTIARRVEKRLQARHIESLSQYLEILEQEPAEAHTLLQELLINVTQFFRDPEAFTALRTEVLPRIYLQAPTREAVRVWVPACATGEEAYSIAILLKEYQHDHGLNIPIQVFATDIDAAAVDVARQGRYPASVVEDIPKDYLTRYFRPQEGGGYQVAQELREICVFSEHNIVRDAPFSRMDLISCRNLFIYWEAELQQKIVPIFHYALNLDGFLFLGPAENIGNVPEYFKVTDKKHRLFQRINTVSRSHFSFPLSTLRARQHVLAGDGTATAHVDKEGGRSIFSALLDEYAPPAVVVNERGDVLFYSGRTGRYLEAPTGAPTQSIFDLIKKPLRAELQALLHKAVKARHEVARPGMNFETDGATYRLTLAVRPLRQPAEAADLFLVIFRESTLTEGKGETSGDDASLSSDAIVQQLESELRDTREHLQSTIEEVRSSNEELLSMNEELQSANEELQTSKEELQSTNEELETVNSELSRKVEELDHANSDLQNFFQSTQIPLLFLDRQFRIQKFTPAATRLFRMIPADIGRSISDIVSFIDSDSLIDEFEEVLRSLQPKDREVRTKDRSASYIMRVSPYRTVTDVINGVVVAFSDVTELKRAQETQRRLAAIVESTSDAIIGRDLKGNITSWNTGAEQLYWYSAAEVVGKPVSVIVPPDRREELLQLAERTLKGETISNVETERVRKDGKRVYVSLTISPIRDDSGQISGFSAISRDISDRKRITEIQAHLAAIVESSDDAIVGKDLNGVITSWNRGAEQLFGYSAQEMVGRTIFQIVPPDHPDDVLRILSTIKRGEKVRHFETERIAKDGRRIAVSLTVSPIRDAAGNVVGASKIARDISDRKRVEAALENSVRLRDEFISLASHELKTPLSTIGLQVEIIKRRLAASDGSSLPPAPVRQLVEQTDKQVQRLTRLINDMLDISRIGLGKLALQRQHTCLSTLVEDVLNSLAEHINAAGCSVTREIAPGVCGDWDQDRVEQIMTNLLTNACRYAPGKPITVRVTQTEHHAILEVKDHGVGIAKENHQRIFERFERVSPLAQGGFGLGLHIVREITKAHGGSVEVHSDLGKGATFTIKLPLQAIDVVAAV